MGFALAINFFSSMVLNKLYNTSPTVLIVLIISLLVYINDEPIWLELSVFPLKCLKWRGKEHTKSMFPTKDVSMGPFSSLFSSLSLVRKNPYYHPCMTTRVRYYKACWKAWKSKGTVQQIHQDLTVHTLPKSWR